jgi:hypothetical protein
MKLLVLLALAFLLPAAALARGNYPPPIVRFWIEGDTQSMAHPYGASKVANWLAMHHKLCELRQSKNIKGVLHTGDIVQYWHDEDDWANADAATQILENCNLHPIFPAGNHDYVQPGIENRDYAFANYDAFMKRHPYPSYLKWAHPDKRAYVAWIWSGHFVVVLPYRALPGEVEWVVERAKTLQGPKSFILIHHFSAWRNGVYSAQSKEVVAKLQAADLNVRAVLGGHARGLPRTEYTKWRSPADLELLSIFSNFQDQEPGYEGQFDGWGTWLELYENTGELCASSESLLTGERNLFDKRECFE